MGDDDIKRLIELKAKAESDSSADAPIQTSVILGSKENEVTHIEEEYNRMVDEGVFSEKSAAADKAY